jgi:hypothetical protein
MRAALQNSTMNSAISSGEGAAWSVIRLTITGAVMLDEDYLITAFITDGRPSAWMLPV